MTPNNLRIRRKASRLDLQASIYRSSPLSSVFWFTLMIARAEFVRVAVPRGLPRYDKSQQK